MALVATSYDSLRPVGEVYNNLHVVYFLVTVISFDEKRFSLHCSAGDSMRRNFIELNRLLFNTCNCNVCLLPVIGIDVDSRKIKLARNNAKVYDVENRIDLMVGDYFRSDEIPKADVVFMSPPWGGPEYNNETAYSFVGMCSEHGGGRRILEIAREIAPKIVIHLPRNLDKHEVSITVKN